MGQNFLADPSTAKKITDQARLSSEDVVLEIGAGLGALTIPVARVVRKVYAVEKDRQIIDLLKTELIANRITNCEIIGNDILQISLDAISDTDEQKLTVMGNLPYGISSQILVKLIGSRTNVKRAVLMFQKELAQRLVAPPGSKDYGRITAMLKYCADVRLIANVNASVFYPSPKVDSSVVEIEFKSTSVYGLHDEAMLFRTIKAAFGNRRKTLKNALSSGGLNIDTRYISTALKLAGIDPSRRAETLEPSEFVSLEICLREAVRGGGN
jgi:16S rRNA (adenine1518-N6/adenine1519-N6)-dimethyltransferase